MRRPRLTYANVVATLALFLALGGAAYAATQLPAGSVGTRQLKAGAVTAGKLSKGVRTRLGKTGARGAEGPAGAEGKQGPEGKEGKQGPAGETLLGAEAPSDLYVRNGFEGSGTIHEGEFVPVSSLTLPAGSYEVTAKVAGEADTADSRLSCLLSDDEEVLDGSSAYIPALGQFGESVLVAAVELGEETAVTLECGAPLGTVKLEAGSTHLLVLPVASIRG